MIAEGTFREDLYYRLRVVEIELPPLRERVGDVPLLAQQLVARACRAMESDAVVLSDEALRTLVAHTWPGNVRELENCLVRAVVLRPRRRHPTRAPDPVDGDQRPRRAVPLPRGGRARSHRSRVRRDGTPKNPDGGNPRRSRDRGSTASF